MSKGFAHELFMVRDLWIKNLNFYYIQCSIFDLMFIDSAHSFKLRRVELFLPL